MRNITITVSDDRSDGEREQVSAEILLPNMNELYRSTGVNGLTQLLHTINDELNKITGKEEEVLVPR